MRFFKKKLTLFTIVVTTTANVFSADLSTLTLVNNWEKLAPGIWKTRIGDVSKEQSYSALAAEKPKFKTLNQFKDIQFPFMPGDIRSKIDDTSNIMIRIPAKKNEAIYGFGLQFDGIKKSQKVLDLTVDHFAKGGGRTHAPVPFYISSRGYGVFFNTARFLKVYVQVGNRKDSTTLPPRIDRNAPSDEKQPGRWDSQPISDAVEAQMNAKGLEIIIFAGDSILDIVRKYNLYSGGGALPPLWGLGFWQRTPAKYNAEKVYQEIANFNKHNIPLDVIGLEPGWQSKSYPCTYEWQKKRFPNPKSSFTTWKNKA